MATTVFHRASALVLLACACVLLNPVTARAQAPDPAGESQLPRVGGRGWTPAGLDPAVANRPPLPCSDSPGPISDRGHWNANLWSGGLIPYEFDANTDAGMQMAARQAMDTLEAVCGARFRPRNGESSFIHLQNSSGNNSPVGQGPGQRTINIFNWNFRFIICHELMHTLGAWHEQSRNDRNTFVMINLANVCQNCCSGGSCNHNFNQEFATDVGPYDFDSVMHYPGDAFSVNGMPTIVVLPPNQAFQATIGQRDHLSAGDINGLVTRYPFSACCDSSGGCTITAQADCGGVWLRDISACSTTACVGACCTPAGSCSLVLPPGCTGPSIFRGIGAPCDAATCSGACCSIAGVCSIVSASACSASNGIFRGTDVPCGPNTCPGACCSQAGGCTFVSALACRAADGTFRATDVPCEPLTCPGACCSSSGDCEFTSAAICAADNRSFRGLDRPCTPLECPGACCLRDRSCIITGFGNCTAQRGEYLGLDTTCTNNPCCCRPWDNGYADGRGGQISQLGIHADWQPLLNTAWDDFALCDGQVHVIEHVSAVVATNAELPKFLVVIVPDCNGLPVIGSPLAVAGLSGTIFDVPQSSVPFILGRLEVEDIDSPDVDGYRPITVTAYFDAKKLVLRGGNYWISFIGISGGADELDEFFWQTSGNLVVKGRPGIFYDGDTYRTSDELCCGCTDYNFCVEGESCKILIDNGPPVVGNFTMFPGIESLSNGNNTATKSRAADQFVLPPCDPFDLCYLEAYIWTNCPRGGVEIYDADRTCPGRGARLRDPDCIIDTGQRLTDPTGREVKLLKLQYFFPAPGDFDRAVLGGPAVRPGKNLFISAFGLGENTQNARGYFAIRDRCDRDCDLTFGPGCFRAAPFAQTLWRKNGISGTSVPGFDHAFLVAVREAEPVPAVVIGPPAEPTCPADVDRNGILSVQDLFDFLAAWFTGCP